MQEQTKNPSRSLCLNWPEGFFFTDRLRLLQVQQVVLDAPRQEAACILAPLLKLQEDGALRFIDARQIAGWAKPSVSQLAVGGIITGYPDGTFRPEKIISRAEAVAIIKHIVHLIAPISSLWKTPFRSVGRPRNSNHRRERRKTA